MTRVPAQRFDPVVCTDETGGVVGLLRVEDFVAAHGRTPVRCPTGGDLWASRPQISSAPGGVGRL